MIDGYRNTFDYCVFLTKISQCFGHRPSLQLVWDAVHSLQTTAVLLGAGDYRKEAWYRDYQADQCERGGPSKSLLGFDGNFCSYTVQAKSLLDDTTQYGRVRLDFVQYSVPALGINLFRNQIFRSCNECPRYHHAGRLTSLHFSSVCN